MTKKSAVLLRISLPNVLVNYKILLKANSLKNLITNRHCCIERQKTNINGTWSTVSLLEPSNKRRMFERRGIQSEQFCFGTAAKSIFVA